MSQLLIQNKLYGRDPEIAALLESFKRIGRGHGEVLLVPGKPGGGKTALVQEIARPVRDRNGFFIQGKFDQYRQNIPYFALRQALLELCRELKSGNPRQVMQYRKDILEAIGNQGQLLVDLVPGFESLLGPQPPLTAISPQEARHRFTGVFEKFLQVVCRPEHPLVLFIDDWQWADAASLELFRSLQVGTALRHLLVIVSYRDNEVDCDHPLTQMIEDMRCRLVPTEVIAVKNLRKDDVMMFLSETMKPAAENSEALATLIHLKSRGNPFFVRSLLQLLLDLNMVRFDGAGNIWQWRVDKNDEADLPCSLVELFASKLRRLDMDSRNLLALAACLGNSFDMEVLSIASGIPIMECRARLLSAKTKDLIIPLEGSSGDATATGNLQLTILASFMHDTVQQAAYALIEPAEHPYLMIKLGRILLARLHPEQPEQGLYEVASKMYAGFPLLEDSAEQLQVFELNIAAARKAYEATAYRAALQFYRAANRFMERPVFAEHLWLEHHGLAMRLFMEMAECEFIEGEPVAAGTCIQHAVDHAATAIEKANALNILIVQYTLLARYSEAIESGRQALAALGITLPSADFEEASNEEILQVRQALKGMPVSKLDELPVMIHPDMLMASKILITMGPPCYRSHQRLWSVIVPKVVNLTLRYGNIPQVGYSHTAFGGLLGWVNDDFATAREFGDVATRIMTGAFQSPANQSVFYLMIGSSIRHWFRHLSHSSQDYLDAYEIGLRSHNLQYAAYAFGHNMYCRFYQGTPLKALIQESQSALAFSRTRLNQWAIDLLEGGLAVFAALSSDGPALHGHKAWSEEEYLRKVEEHDNIQVACIYKVLKTFSLLLLGDHDDALALSDKVEPLIYTVGTQGLLPWPEHLFARLLILTALYEAADGARQTLWRRELDRIAGKLRIWADTCHENFGHKSLLAEAELARIGGRPFEAMGLYDQAVEEARAGRFLQWEGMANERACGFWLKRGNASLAHAYWQEAYACYDRWGAVAKVRSMETAYRAYLADSIPVGNESSKQADTGELDSRNMLIKKQIAQLRNYAGRMQENRLLIEKATETEELVLATERLRVEIVERRKAEEALRESAMRYKLVTEGAAGGTWDWDIPNRRVHFSTRWKAIRGFGAAEIGDSESEWSSRIHPDDAQRVMASVQAHLAGKTEFFEEEYRTRCRDGSWVYILDRGKAFRDDTGTVVRMAGSEIDITSRKQAETELLASEKLFKTLSEASPSGIWLADHGGGNTYVSPRWSEITGVSAEDAAGNGWAGAIHADDKELVFSAWRQAAQADKNYKSEFRFVRPDGSVVWVLSIAKLIEDPVDNSKNWVGTITDISDRKEAEDSLRGERQRLASIVTGSNVGTWEWNVQTGETVFNERWAEIVGYTLEEISPTSIETWREFTHPDDLVSCEEMLEKYLRGDIDCYDIELRMMHRDGSLVWVLDRGKVVSRTEDGKPLLMMGTHADITRRKRMDEVQVFLAKTSSWTTEESLYNALARYLAQALKMDAIHICLLEKDGLNARTMAFWLDGHFEDNVTYALKDTPFGQAMGNALFSIPDSVSRLFPRHALLRDLRAESYVGVTLWSHTGEPIGLIAAISRSPLEKRKLAEDTLKLVSIRAASEIERQMAYEKLRQSETHYRTLFNLGPYGIVTIDPETAAFIDFNDKACLQLGYTRDEFARMRLFDIEGIEVPKETRAHIKRLATEGYGEFETEHRNREGELRNIHVRAQYSNIGGKQCILCTFCDITRQKKEEQILQTRLHLDEFSISHSLDELLTETLDKVEELTGSLIGFFHFVHEDLGNLTLHAWSTRTISAYCTAQGAGSHYPIENAGVWVDCVRQGKPVIHNDYASLPHRKGLPPGHAPVIRELAVPISRSGAILGVLGIGNKATDYTEEDISLVARFADLAWDIAERKQVHESLRESNERFSTAFKNAPLMIAISTLEDGTYLDVNQRFLDISGFNREEVIGKTSVELGWITGSDRERMLESLQKEDRIQNLELELRTKSGKTLLGAYWGEIITVAGKKRVLSIGLDITENRNIEEQLFQAQKMESVGRLAGGVAHDFNNMLSVIICYAEMALKKLKPDQPISNFIEEIIKAAQRSVELTRQLLAFARKQTAAPIVLDLKQTLAGMINMLKRLIGEDIELQLLSEDGLWPVNMDPSQVDQVLANLCVNARDAISSIGRVVIEMGNCSLSEDYCAAYPDLYPGEYVRLSITDNGCGMEKEIIDRIFEPFFSTKETGKGTGLGLATVYGIVKQNNGFINVYSEPGKGTTFTVYLPRHTDGVVQIRQEINAQPSRGGGETILLVEDDPSILEMTNLSLTMLGYNVLPANAPGKAISLASEHTGDIRLLLTDVIMPGMNGRDLAEKLMHLYPQLKILFMSGYTADVISTRGFLAESVNFMQKPFTLESLASKIRATLDGIAES